MRCLRILVVLLLIPGLQPWNRGTAASAEESLEAVEPGAVILSERIVPGSETRLATSGVPDTDLPRRAKNVILMIGDGMGPQQMGMLFAYSHYAKRKTENQPQCSAMEEMVKAGRLGIVRTEPKGVLVTDSAAAATQMCTGAWSASEMLGTDYRGQPVPTVVEIARDLGKQTGLISDTRITHATPAAFASHLTARYQEDAIAIEMLENRVDVMLSGGLRHWVPQSVNDRQSATYLSLLQMVGGAYDPISKRTDSRNLLLEARNDYQLVFDCHSLAELSHGRVLGLFANSEMLDAIGERNRLATGNRTEPTLVEMSEKALELLSQNSKGFFLMVEGGQIDWTGHNNDTGSMLEEVRQFDDAVRAVFNWAKQRDDTLVLVTADHETGSFGFSYSGYELPDPEKDEFAPNFNYAPQELLDKIAQQKKSYYQIFTEFDALPSEERSPEKLQEVINAAVSPFSITLEDATKILTRSPNRYYREGHPYLGTRTLPQMPDQEAFFVYGENLRMNRLGHILGKQQHVVWGTGTHTGTPVVVVSFGPGCDQFTGIMHSTELGQRMIQIVRGQ